jgi:phage N-6-adenine-methyltransferase
MTKKKKPQSKKPSKLDVHFSSAKEDWTTPPVFFENVQKNLGVFDLDVAASFENAVCDRYVDKSRDALSMDWATLGAKNIWCNPPYGRDLYKWLQKGYEASLKGVQVTFLVPARTDTRWFHDYALPYGLLGWVRGRLKFGGSKNSAPFPSLLVTFRPQVLMPREDLL